MQLPFLKGQSWNIIFCIPVYIVHCAMYTWSKLFQISTENKIFSSMYMLHTRTLPIIDKIINHNVISELNCSVLPKKLFNFVSIFFTFNTFHTCCSAFRVMHCLRMCSCKPVRVPKKMFTHSKSK